MGGFDYRSGRLHAEDVDLARLAGEVGTPFYCYSASTLRRRYRRLAGALAPSGARIFYAVKANGNLAVIDILARLGAGADVVSEGEIRRCLAAGVDAADIVFSGVGKSEGELRFALACGIRQINVESEDEFERICGIAAACRREARVVFRLNPDVDAGGHDKISTGRRTDKFGLSAGTVRRLHAGSAAHRWTVPVGLAVHIGSQIHDVGAYRAAFARVTGLAAELGRSGPRVERLDLGGGLGIAYLDGEEEIDLDAYARLLADIREETDAELIVEPGRWLVAPAGVLVTEVNTVKEAGGRRVVIVDAAMNDLLRPTLYGARHPVWPVEEPAGALHEAVVAGPVCESGDILSHGAHLPALRGGDLLAIGQAGAYGAVMSSGYNGRPLVPEVMVRNGSHAVVRRRPGHEEMMALESVSSL